MPDIIQEIKKLSLKKEIKSTDHLKNDLNMDSMQLIELVVVVSEFWNIDLGQMASEGHAVNTVGDIEKIIKASA
jgi:acyl carrier protein